MTRKHFAFCAKSYNGLWQQENTYNCRAVKVDERRIEWYSGRIGQSPDILPFYFIRKEDKGEHF